MRCTRSVEPRAAGTRDKGRTAVPTGTFVAGRLSGRGRGSLTLATPGSRPAPPGAVSYDRQ